MVHRAQSQSNSTESTAGNTDRRGFLAAASAGAAAASLALGGAAGAVETPAIAPAVEPLPTIQLGEHRISRMIAGANQIAGHSHTTIHMANHMRSWFTLERTIEFLKQCEREGITCWQFSGKGKETEACKAMRDQGSKLKYIVLMAQRSVDEPLEKVIAEVKPIAIVHHGNVTDAAFAAGRQEQVRDFVKKVKDLGVLAGVSAHNPDNIRRVADAGWENDFFMCCFYYVTRPREEQREKLTKVTVGEPFFESDPADMTKVMREVKKPCLGFKILAAGRVCWSKYAVDNAFRFAFENIKPIDGVIVGMMPEFSDEVRQNCDLVRKYGAAG